MTDSTDVATSAAAGRESDGVLTIGTLLPVTGPGNEIGLAGLNAVNVGIREINDDGGVLGQPVRLVNADEGTTIADARAGIDKLLWTTMSTRSSDRRRRTSPSKCSTS